MACQYRKHLSEPWFTLMKDGRKTIEGRLYQNDWTKINVNDIIVFYNGDNEVKMKVIRTQKYDSFMMLLEEEGLKKCLPICTNIDDGVKIYESIYDDRDKQYGVIAIELSL